MGRRAVSTQDRRAYLGGHDAAAIVGASRYSSPSSTYARIVLGVEREDNPAMLRGRILEPGIREWVAQQRRTEVEPWFVIDDRVPFFGGSPDGVEPGARVIHEIKTTRAHLRDRWGVPDTADVPPQVFVQCQWYMGLIPSARECFVWVYFLELDEEPVRYLIERSDVSITALRERCEAWWFDHVVMRKPPPLDALDLETADALWPRATKDVIQVADDSEIAIAAARYEAARTQIKALQDEKEASATAIKAALQEHKGARFPGGTVSWSERALPTKTNWEGIAYEIAQRAKLPGEVFNGLVQENTNDKATTRTLRVTMKKGQQS